MNTVPGRFQLPLETAGRRGESMASSHKKLGKFPQKVRQVVASWHPFFGILRDFSTPPPPEKSIIRGFSGRAERKRRD